MIKNSTSFNFLTKEAILFLSFCIAVPIAYNYGINLLRSNKLNEQKKTVENLHQKIDDLQNKFTLLEIEHKMLIRDYITIDSMLNSYELDNINYVNNEKPAVENLNYKELENDNLALRSKISKLLNEIQTLQNEVSLHKNEKLSLKIEIPKNTDKTKENTNIEINNINIDATTYFNHSKGKRITSNSRRARLIEVCIDFSEVMNNFSLNNREFYLRIADPKGKILTCENPNNNVFKFNEQKIVYSNKILINKTNISAPICITYNSNVRLIPGIYWIDVFVDEVKIGETSFELK